MDAFPGYHRLFNPDSIPLGSTDQSRGKLFNVEDEDKERLSIKDTTQVTKKL